jgi:hypothetical protein
MEQSAMRESVRRTPGLRFAPSGLQGRAYLTWSA